MIVCVAAFPATVGAQNPDYTPANPDYTPAAPPAGTSPSSPPSSSSPATSPSNSPKAGALPSIPLVAALTMPKGQSLGRVLRQGLRLRVYAYRPIQLAVAASLVKPTAKRLHLRRGTQAIPKRSFGFDKAGIRVIRVRLAHRDAQKLRHARTLKLRLHTTLRADKSVTSTDSPVTLTR